jgi:hypothetical protein
VIRGTKSDRFLSAFRDEKKVIEFTIWIRVS